ncbi:hypothetical protein [Allorhodopirellula solitaria]|uniref:Uncharacterized protein n=1 Tax=Allorhodopirellula solitaria TaxID=2527987 RepID=A0A5C5XTA7_9BACT|nr:hypothetical protein [Allorhodopirellula solitaria]TWT66496.1 hypothetical protein CA85_25910 [Allorhodopirellula solitaria]
MKRTLPLTVAILMLGLLGCGSSSQTNVREGADDQAIADYEAAIAELEESDNNAEQ